MKQIGEFLKDRCSNDKGFTLIEIIAVLIILGIIAAVAISRGTGTDAAQLQAEVDTLKGHLRYAQYLAMNDISSDATSPTKWGIIINGSSYTLIKDVNGTQPSPFNLPGESSAIHTSTISGAGTGTVLFDEWGSPSVTAVTFGGQTITITPETGFLP